jgi:D-threitol dehydrogenase (NAD+)
MSLVAVVTGAGRGSGQAAALKLAAAGARVALVDINPNAAERTLDAVVAAGGIARAEPVDVSNKMAVQTVLYSLLEVWERVDVLVNCAEVTPGSSALKLDEWEWNRTLDVNLKGAFLMAQTVARAMQATGGGLIINLVRPAQAAEHAAVAAARAGLAAMTGTLAAEWAGHGVRVEALAPAATHDQTAEQMMQHVRALMDVRRRTHIQA